MFSQIQTWVLVFLSFGDICCSMSLYEPVRLYSRVYGGHNPTSNSLQAAGIIDEDHMDRLPNSHIRLYGSLSTVNNTSNGEIHATQLLYPHGERSQSRARDNIYTSSTEAATTISAAISYRATASGPNPSFHTGTGTVPSRSTIELYDEVVSDEPWGDASQEPFGEIRASGEGEEEGEEEEGEKHVHNDEDDDGIDIKSIDRREYQDSYRSDDPQQAEESDSDGEFCPRNQANEEMPEEMPEDIMYSLGEEWSEGWSEDEFEDELEDLVVFNPLVTTYEILTPEARARHLDNLGILVDHWDSIINMTKYSG